jgi:hypothetical protein
MKKLPTQKLPSPNSIGILFPEITIDDKTIIDVWSAYRISPEFKEQNFTFDYYTVKENDRWDIISERLYGKREYWWIIAMFNDIDDPFTIYFDRNVIVRTDRIRILDSSQISLLLNSIRKFTEDRNKYVRYVK